MSDISANKDQADAKLEERFFLIAITAMIAIEIGVLVWIVF